MKYLSYFFILCLLNFSYSQNIENEYQTKISFSELNITFDNLEVWDNENKLKEIQKDTANITLGLGEPIGGKVFKINQSKFDKVEIYQRYENSITVMDEGPHCDLTEWKHYYSEWKLLKPKGNNYITDSHPVKDWEKFISVSAEEIIDAVKEHCGFRWSEHVKNIKSASDYPCGVSTSKIFLKIILERSESGIIKEKTISIEIPMGC